MVLKNNASASKHGVVTASSIPDIL